MRPAATMTTDDLHQARQQILDTLEQLGAGPNLRKLTQQHTATILNTKQTDAGDAEQDMLLATTDPNRWRSRSLNRFADILFKFQHLFKAAANSGLTLDTQQLMADLDGLIGNTFDRNVMRLPEDLRRQLTATFCRQKLNLDANDLEVRDLTDTQLQTLAQQTLSVQLSDEAQGEQQKRANQAKRQAHENQLQSIIDRALTS